MAGAAHFHRYCGVVPPYLLVRLARSVDPRLSGAAAAARSTLLHDGPARQVRDREAPTRAELGRPGILDRSVSDARGEERFPGPVLRREGTPDAPDPVVNRVFDALGDVHRMLSARFNRDSLDDLGLPLEATVHFGRHYDNAFWDGTRLVIGDGDGVVFTGFSRSLTVIGHELAHGLIQYSARLRYRGQSGALSESIADVFGSLADQYTRGIDGRSADWLIGAGLFTELVDGTALRSMREPGTAFNDDVLGMDLQPATMADYVDTVDDDGGVHVNSGIPNRAFFLVADTLGGNAWDAPGQIWYDALTGGTLAPTATFSDLAAATESAAAARFGSASTEHNAVASAWDAVGVTAADRGRSG